MQIVKARFRTKEELLDALVRDLPNGGMFVPTTTPLVPNTEVVVELNCDGLPNKVLIRSLVRTWRPALPRLRVRAGATVEFASDEHDKYAFVLKTIEGALPSPQRRRHARIPVAIPVDYRLRDTSEVRHADLTEISIGGALLRTEMTPPIGTEVVLSLTPPGGAAPMEILGKVSYLVPTRGAGLKFTFRDGGGARRLRELIRRFRVA
jgi:Tfp pilus assembly protein PilZ